MTDLNTVEWFKIADHEPLKEVELLVYMPEATLNSGSIHRAIWLKTSNAHLCVIGHHFKYDCEPITHWAYGIAPPPVE